MKHGAGARPPNSDGMTPEKRLDALAEALAEGVLYLAERGLLDGEDPSAATAEAKQNPPTSALHSGGKEGTS